MLVRIHRVKRLEAIRLFYRPEFRDVGRTACHQFGTHRIGIAYTDERRVEQIGALGDGSANSDSSSARPFSCQLRRGSVFVFDQVLSAGKKVVNRVLLGQQPSGIVPVFPILSAAAHVCDGKNSSSL